MSKVGVIKKVMKYEVSKLPLWAWISCFLLIVLLRYQIANMLGTLLPLSILVTGILFFIGDKSNSTKVGIFTVYSLFIISFF